MLMIVASLCPLFMFYYFTSDLGLFDILLVEILEAQVNRLITLSLGYSRESRLGPISLVLSLY